MGFTIQEMISVMDDQSFTNLEELLNNKRENIQLQIDDLKLQLEEINDFIASGKEDTN